MANESRVERCGRYVLHEVVGEGGMGLVYRGWDPELERDVAVKIIDGWQLSPDTLERFRREARALASLPHPNIVSVFDVGTEANAPYIVMELVEGSSLAQVIAAGTVRSFEQKLRTMLGICDALDAAHRAGVIHRDVKPANILIGRDGRARLADFGIARVFNSTLTSSGGVLGTLAYLAPEVLAGGTPDARSDVYGSAVCLYEWLCGELPHSADDARALAARAQTTDPPMLGDRWLDCPPSLERCIHRGLHRDPRERFASAEEFARALKTILGDADVSVPAAPVAPDSTEESRDDAPDRARPSRAWLAIAAVLLVTAGSWTAWSSWRQPATGREDKTQHPAPGAQEPVANLAALPAGGAPPAAAPPRDETKTPASSSMVSRGTTPPNGPTPPGDQESDDAVVPAVPIGTRIRVRLTSELRSDQAIRGHRFRGELVDPLTIGGTVVAGAATVIEGLVDGVDAGGNDRPPSLQLSLSRLIVDGHEHAIRSARYEVVAPPPSNGRSFARLIIAASIGGAIGAGVAGREGAVTGAALGAAAAARNSEPPADFIISEPLTFRLAAPFVVKSRSSMETSHASK